MLRVACESQSSARMTHHIGLLVSLSLLACATETTPFEGGKADGERSVHARAVAACGDGEDLETHLCVRAANEAATATIDSIAGGVVASSALFGDYEDRAGSICATFGESLVESSREGFVARCRVTRSRDLAALIDAYVAFDDGVAIAVPHREADFVDCREAYDAAKQDAVSTQDAIAAATTLRECIEEETRIAGTELAALLEVPDGEQRISAALDTALGAAISACTVVAAASGEAGGSLETVIAADCQADAAAQIGSLVLDSIPME